jgi:hypothetical protein
MPDKILPEFAAQQFRKLQDKLSGMSSRTREIEIERDAVQRNLNLAQHQLATVKRQQPTIDKQELAIAERGVDYFERELKRLNERYLSLSSQIKPLVDLRNACQTFLRSHGYYLPGEVPTGLLVNKEIYQNRGKAVQR